MTNVLVTGSEGFISTNLIAQLRNIHGLKIFNYNKKSKNHELDLATKKCDLVFHLAGENRSNNKKNFKYNNQNLTKKLCNYLIKNRNKSPIIYSSTIKFKEKTIYGKSKKSTELILKNYSKKYKTKVDILRIPNVFGKWSRQNYNSFLITMCYNISRGKSFKIDEFNKEISLIYIDDLIKKLLKYVVNKKQNNKFKIININSTKKIKIINLYKKIESFWKAQRNNFLPEIKNQFDKNLYSTFLYYLPRSKIVMPKTIHKDERGIFSEIFKTQNQGQVSIFSINPGKTRGGHFHHSKNEKFVLIKGKTLFRAFDLKNKKKYQLTLQEEKINEVLSIPGHWHEIVNTGKSKAYFLLWSNEVYDKNKPDTFIKKNV